MARRTKRKDGRLQKSFRVRIKDIDKRFVVYGHNEAELAEKERNKRKEIEKSIEVLDNPSVNEYYMRWKKRRTNVSEATIRTQDKFFGVMRKIKIPELRGVCFGDIKLKKVNIDILYSLQTELKKTRRSQTVNDYMALIKHIFSDAKNEFIIERNYCQLLKNIKRTEEQATYTHHRALSIEEQKSFFENERCKNSYYYNVFCFAIRTGMRIGEIGALKYSDIRNGEIHVERTVTRTELGNFVIGSSAKTRAGKRTIPLNTELQDIIEKQKVINEILDEHVRSYDEDLLFRAPGGGLLLATHLDRELKRICEDANIEHFTMHAFRATFATRAVESGMNPKTLQEILGHSNFNITMTLYAHCLSETKKREMDKVNIII